MPLTQEELKDLITANEADRVEMTRSTTDTDKFREAICSFSNDMAGHGKPGYLIIGVDPKDPSFRLQVTDDQLQQFAAYRSDGSIIPLPSLHVSQMEHPDGGGDVIVVEVQPHDLPPVRYKGRSCIRVGPRKDYASESEERILIERRTANFKTYDATPCPEGDLVQMDLQTFRQVYRPEAIAADVIKENNRTLEEQLAALRFYNLKRQCPTNAGMLVFGIDPRDIFPGAYIQFVQFDGTELSDDPIAEKRFSGSLITVLSELDLFIKGRFTSKPVKNTELKETSVFDYPPDAIREILMNAVLHRDYQSTTPVKYYQFSDRIEIHNPGGLYGEASRENFPRVTSYRNPIIAEVMYTLGYVNRFGRGIARAGKELEQNGSPEPRFDLQQNYFLATISKHPDR